MWVKNANKGDNERYQSLMCYMEEKRKKAREKLRKEEKKKALAKSKTDSWAMMREAIRIIREK